ncbi:MAG: DUF3592 domain-containing protein [Candidatus Omnitrophota bacterium]
MKKLPLSTWVTAVVVLGGAFYFIHICRQGLSQEFVEHRWNTASAVVLDPDLKLDGKKNTARITEGIEQTLNYEYSVGGRTYQSNSVSKELMVNKDEYPAGKTIQIYYNPADESESVLIRTPVQKQYLLAMIGFCCVSVGIIIFSLIKDLRKQ